MTLLLSMWMKYLCVLIMSVFLFAIRLACGNAPRAGETIVRRGAHG